METGTAWPRAPETVAVDVAVGVDCGIGDRVEIFRHGDGDADVERIAFCCVAMEDEIAGDGAVGDADGGAGGTA